jgi:hypothetical protein
VALVARSDYPCSTTVPEGTIDHRPNERCQLRLPTMAAIGGITAAIALMMIAAGVE